MTDPTANNKELIRPHQILTKRIYVIPKKWFITIRKIRPKNAYFLGGYMAPWSKWHHKCHMAVRLY